MSLTPAPDWPATAPLVLTLENYWLNRNGDDASPHPQGRAFWVDSQTAREALKHLERELGISWIEAGGAFAESLARGCGINDTLSVPLSWEWRRLARWDRGAPVDLATLRCLCDEKLDPEKTLERLGLIALGELPCAPDENGFVGPSLPGWLAAIEALKQKQEIESAALGVEKKPRAPRL